MPRGAGRDLNLYLYDKSERGWEDRKYTQTAKQSERVILLLEQYFYCKENVILFNLLYLQVRR